MSVYAGIEQPPRAADPPPWLADPSAASDPTWHLGEQLQAGRADLRRNNALLQTPAFVADLILDLTLGGRGHRSDTPVALDDFPLPEVTLIDPSCGSGNFLCAAYMRLAAQWWALKPDGAVLSVGERKWLAQRTLGQVSGVDIDPDCVDLACRRLSTLADQYAGIPDGVHPWDLRVACADSLMHGPDSSGYVPGPSHLCGDRDCRQALSILSHQTYAVVVGNPPYITVKDRAKNAAYRRRYGACSGQYSLAVPFSQLMFALAHRGPDDLLVGRVRLAAETQQSTQDGEQQ